MRGTLLVGSLSFLAIVACRGGGSTPGPDTNNTGDTNGAIHIQDVQNDSMPPGTPVELHGVIVTAIDNFGNKTGDIWIEEPGGGPFSGVHVFGAATADVAGLALGDIVDVTGAVKDEFAISSDTSGRTVTELKPAMSGSMHVTKTGAGAVPAAEVVDALAIGQLATQPLRDAEWEKWEGVLITVTNVTAVSAPKCITSMGMCTDPSFQNFSITGVAKAESSLVAFPTGIAAGDCFASMTGVVDYVFDYQILPRSATDIATGGTACPPPENTVAACTDGTDNDGNGFSDCNDNACIVPAPACHPAATIPQIQGSTPMGGVELTDVIVTGISFDRKKVWLATSATAQANNGVFVFQFSTALDASIVVGTKLSSLIGKVSEFNDDSMGSTLTEVSPLAFTAAPDAAATIVPVTGMTAQQLLDGATAPTFESVAVTLTNVNIMTLGASANGFIATAKQSGQTFGVGTDIIRLTAGQLGCYASVTGFWTSLQAGSSSATMKPNAYGFIVQSLGAAGTACN